jgi:hypothetical protein
VGAVERLGVGVGLDHQLGEARLARPGERVAQQCAADAGADRGRLDEQQLELARWGVDRGHADRRSVALGDPARSTARGARGGP